MNFLTRPLIEGPPSFSLPPIRFVRDPRAEITLTTNEDLVSPDALDIPITRWDHKLPSTREDWYMLWPLHLVHGRSFCDPYNREHPIPEDFPQVAPNFWQMSLQLYLNLVIPEDSRRPCICPLFALRCLHLPKPALRCISNCLGEGDASALCRVSR